MASKHEDLVDAFDEALRRNARRKRQVRDVNASMQMFVACVGGFAFLYSFLPGLLHGALAWLLIGGALLSGGLAIVQERQRGGSVTRALAGLVFFGALTFGMVYGTYWYFMVYLASQPLFTFPGAPTP